MMLVANRKSAGNLLIWAKAAQQALFIDEGITIACECGDGIA